MSEVTTINRSVALKKLSLLKVNRLDNSWLPALCLARHLLKEDDGLNSDAGESSAFEMRLDTSRVWERVLIDLLEMAQVSKLIDLNSQGPIPIKFMRPWSGLGNIIDSPRPDIIFQVSDKWWIFDAKYRRNNSGVPEMSEQYQMFAYSHLIENLNIRDLALVYPTKSQSRKPLGPYARNDSNDVQLSIGYIPFPSVHDLFSSWETYLEKTVGMLNQIFDHRDLTGPDNCAQIA
jgi:5-methylcytosine-specific restriction endonuclease McrBC regulatory subunit McrC